MLPNPKWRAIDILISSDFVLLSQSIKSVNDNTLVIASIGDRKELEYLS